MNKMKPVWRMNTGNPAFDVSKNPSILYSNGTISNSPQTLGASDFDWSFQGRWDDIAAYQTNRTKVAKYEWVECGKCNGSGNRIEHKGIGVAAWIGGCRNCNGHGHTWERTK